MPQPLTPTQLHPETPLLLTRPELLKWLKVSRTWLDMRLADDPQFVKACVIDIATPGSSHRKLRFPVRAVAEYLGIPEYATPNAPARAAA
ncbi:hypothetical protein [Streptomyces sp. NPDC088794]|uniref:hypothetical protein n=1 Tax=Streptomyces sp. NPDC088794 TaxID=3365902 RepID=UPI0037F78439